MLGNFKQWAHGQQWHTLLSVRYTLVRSGDAVERFHVCHQVFWRPQAFVSTLPQHRPQSADLSALPSFCPAIVVHSHTVYDEQLLLTRLQSAQQHSDSHFPDLNPLHLTSLDLILTTPRQTPHHQRTSVCHIATSHSTVQLRSKAQLLPLEARRSNKHIHERQYRSRLVTVREILSRLRI